jgi:flagellar biosynthetic protein FliQ
MTIDTALELCRQTILMALLVGAPTLAAALLAGLLVSLGQAVTQLQDQTLSFVPKLLAMTAALVWTLPWALGRLVEYAADLFRNVPGTLS